MVTLTKVDQKQCRVVCLLLAGDICINTNKSEVKDRHVTDVKLKRPAPTSSSGPDQRNMWKDAARLPCSAAHHPGC